MLLRSVSFAHLPAVGAYKNGRLASVKPAKGINAKAFAKCGKGGGKGPAVQCDYLAMASKKGGGEMCLYRQGAEKLRSMLRK